MNTCANVQKNIQVKNSLRTSLTCNSDDLTRIKKQADYHGRSEVGHLRKMMDKEDKIIIKELEVEKK